jgi:nicotinate-nucleotide adenylyltransferase
VRALPALLGEGADASLFLILGSDNLVGLQSWRAAGELLERVQPIVVHREGEPEPALRVIERELGPEAARRIRAGYLALPPVEASSTDLRARLPALGAKDLALPARVLEYIRARGLYGTRT